MGTLSTLFGGGGGDYYKSLSRDRNQWMNDNGYSTVPYYQGVDLNSLYSDPNSTISDEQRTAYTDWQNKYAEGIKAYDKYLADNDPNKLALNTQSMTDHNNALGQVNKYGGTLSKAIIAAIGGGAAASAAGLGGAAGAGGTGATDLASLSAADAAGGLLPEFGTIPAYEAGLGNSAGWAAAPSLGGVVNPGNSGLANAATIAGIQGDAAAGLEGLTNWGGSGIPGASANGAPYSLSSATGLGDIAKAVAPDVTKATSVADFLKQLFPSNTAGSLGNLLSTGLGAWSAYQQGQQANNLSDSLMGLFGPNNAYATELRKQLERKDAAAGRRSQYGPREVELQARLAEQARMTAGDILKAQAVAGGNQDRYLGNLFNVGQQVYNQLPSWYNSISSLFGQEPPKP